MVAASSSSSEFGSLFAAFDKDADGRISAAELRLCMRAMLGEDAEALVASVDTDGDGLLDGDEFTRLVRAEVVEEERHRGIKAAFGMYEMGEGWVHHVHQPEADAQQARRAPGDRRLRAMICRFDLNGDGVLSFDEFKIMMNA